MPSHRMLSSGRLSLTFKRMLACTSEISYREGFVGLQLSRHRKHHITARFSVQLPSQALLLKHSCKGSGFPPTGSENTRIPFIRSQSSESLLQRQSVLGQQVGPWAYSAILWKTKGRAGSIPSILALAPGTLGFSRPLVV